jgi:DNA gyrase/topoisomerase IV subunit A
MPDVMSHMKKSTIEKDLKINFWRQHIMEGLLRARKSADEIKEILKDRDNAEKVLTEKYGFSPHQAQSLLDLRKSIDEIDEQPILNELVDLKKIESQLKRQLS